MAERIGDPATLALALEGQWVATEGPEVVARATVVATARMIELAERDRREGAGLRGTRAPAQRLWCSATAPRSTSSSTCSPRLVDELRQPAQRWHIGTVRTMLALMEGRFEEAERLIGESLLGQRVERWNAVVTQRLALFVLRREQGRLAELADTIALGARVPVADAVPCALAHLDAELGREREARAASMRLLARDLEREYRDAEWLFSMALLADPCASVATSAAAARLYGLLPFAHLYTLAPIEASSARWPRPRGARERAAIRRRRAPPRGRDRPRAANGARPWLAHAQHNLAAALLARGRPVDRPRSDASEQGVRRRPKGLADRLLSRTPSLSARTTNRVRWRRRTPTRPLWHG